MSKIIKFGALSVLGITMGTTVLNTEVTFLNHQVTSVSASKKSKAKVKSVNKDIAEALKEDQGFGNGTLDENGNPTDSGTPIPEFSWSLIVDKIKYSRKNDRVTVTVFNDFNNLSTSDKKSVAKSAQNLAASVLVNYYKEYQSADKPSTEVLDTNGNALAHSKILDTKNFTIYK